MTLMKTLKIEDEIFDLDILKKIASIEAENYIKARASHGSREKFLKVLEKVPE